MSGETSSAIVFFVAATVAVVAAIVALVGRRPATILGGHALTCLALLVPFVQLQAPGLAALVLLMAVVGVALAAGVSAGSRTPEDREDRRPRIRLGRRSLPRPRLLTIVTSLGLLGVVWVLLATGSRQVVEPLPANAPAGSWLAALAGPALVPSLLLAALALCALIAAALAPVDGEARDGSASAGSSQRSPTKPGKARSRS